MKRKKREFYSPATDPDGSYTGNRKREYSKDEILPGETPPDKPLQDVDDL